MSGGERKRVTTAEMVVGPRRVLLMDEISTGLDSATLYDVITFFGAVRHTDAEDCRTLVHCDFLHLPVLHVATG